MTDRALPDQTEPIEGHTIKYIRTRVKCLVGGGDPEYPDVMDSVMTQFRAFGIVQGEMLSGEPRPTIEAVAWWIRQAKVIDAVLVEYDIAPYGDNHIKERIVEGGHGLTMVDLDDMSGDAWTMVWEEYCAAKRRGEGKSREGRELTMADFEEYEARMKEAAKATMRLIMQEAGNQLISDRPGEEEAARIVQEHFKRLAAMTMPSGEPLKQIEVPDGTMTCERHEPVEFTIAPFEGAQWCPNCLSLHDKDGKHYLGKLSFDGDGGLLFQPPIPLNYISMTVTLPEGSYDPCSPVPAVSADEDNLRYESGCWILYDGERKVMSVTQGAVEGLMGTHGLKTVQAVFEWMIEKKSGHLTLEEPNASDSFEMPEHLRPAKAEDAPEGYMLCSGCNGEKFLPPDGAACGCGRYGKHQGYMLKPKNRKGAKDKS